MVNLQKERSQTHQKSSFQDKMTPKQCEKECQSINIIKWVFEFNIFFKWKHIKVNSLFKDSHCAFVKQEFTRQRQRRQFRAASSNFSAWECVRTSGRGARLPGRCAALREQNLHRNLHARGYLGSAWTSGRGARTSGHRVVFRPYKFI